MSGEVFMMDNCVEYAILLLRASYFGWLLIASLLREAVAKHL